MNLLILSCGTRNKVVQYFRKAFGEEGKVIPMHQHFMKGTIIMLFPG